MPGGPRSAARPRKQRERIAALLCASVVVGASAAAGCSRHRGDPAGSQATPSASGATSTAPSALIAPPVPEDLPIPEDLLPEEPPPMPPKGMVWIPPGILLAGTPENRVPRIADAEMPGEQVVMKGFFIDEFPFPNESGAIPRTRVTWQEAADACEEINKRLCTELEWERACKGPKNWTYPYADTYHAPDCQTGEINAAVPPVGMLEACHSGFGVRDLHGGVFQWTASPWGRGTTGKAYTLRGGNGAAGDVVGRCANAIGRRPDEAGGDFGFRCCSGDRNLAEVTVNVVRGDKIRFVAQPPPEWTEAIRRDPPPELVKKLAETPTPFVVRQGWRWSPIGNEELLLVSGCASTRPHAECGLVIYRVRGKQLEPMSYLSTAWWVPMLHEDDDPRDVWVFGGDHMGAFTKKLSYAFGRVVASEPEYKAEEAKIHEQKKKRKRKKKK
jgi:formylglycine-generating enzyme